MKLNLHALAIETGLADGSLDGLIRALRGFQANGNFTVSIDLVLSRIEEIRKCTNSAYVRLEQARASEDDADEARAA